MRKKSTMKFAKFMSKPSGRILRAVAGVALVAIALAIGGGWGIVLIVIGTVFILAGVANWCFIAPLLRVPFRGSKLPA
jgi:hypothetical protein